MRHLERGGPYLRVADPTWAEPLSGEYSKVRGGRWNAPGAFAVVYLNVGLDVAQAQVHHKLVRRGIEPEDLRAEQGPSLVETVVPRGRYVDAVTTLGIKSLGLPGSYPLTTAGQVVSHARCRPIGRRARDAGEPGIACLSAATRGAGEELAYMATEPLRIEALTPFADWYWR